MHGKLKHKDIKLRALEPDDLDWLYNCENDPEIWHLSNTRLPFSRHLLSRYIEQAQESIFVQGQVRFVIADYSGKPYGMLDFFDFDPFHQRAGIGIMVCKEVRGQGYAAQALDLAKAYAFEYLNLHQLYCNIAASNTASIKLFSSAGFRQSGIKKDWLKLPDGFEDELIFQYLG
ncbi:MAG: GNAT family N-acetyltransferase [Bacteroidales bacterium]